MLASWIAMFAILLASLAPTISHALAAHEAQPNASLIEICTADGIRTIAVDDSLNPAATAPANHAQHSEQCPFCKPNSIATALAPSAELVIAISGDDRIIPPLFYQASHGIFAWTVASPRAPPFVS